MVFIRLGRLPKSLYDSRLFAPLLHEPQFLGEGASTIQYPTTLDSFATLAPSLGQWIGTLNVFNSPCIGHSTSQRDQWKLRVHRTEAPATLLVRPHTVQRADPRRKFPRIEISTSNRELRSICPSDPGTSE